MATRKNAVATAEKPAEGEVLPPEKKAIAVASAQSTALALPTTELEGMAGDGLENVTSKDVIVPRIGIIQKTSPQIDKNEPEYIKGAEIGDFVDHSSSTIYKGELIFMPCYYVMMYLQWAPRESGRGLQGIHSSPAILNDCTQEENGRRMVLPNGDYISETASWYGLNLSDGGKKAFIPMSSTQLKNSRKWMTLVTNEKVARSVDTEKGEKPGARGFFTPPLFYRAWVLTGVGESNSKGSWIGWKATPGETTFELDPSKSLLGECKAFADSLRSGDARGDLKSYADDLARGKEHAAGDDTGAM